jgi:hypothetical protein
MKATKETIRKVADHIGVSIPKHPDVLKLIRIGNFVFTIRNEIICFNISSIFGEFTAECSIDENGFLQAAKLLTDWISDQLCVKESETLNK